MNKCEIDGQCPTNNTPNDGLLVVESQITLEQRMNATIKSLRNCSVLLLSLLLLHCAGLGSRTPYLTRPITQDYTSISDPKTRWATYKLTNYVLDQEIQGFANFNGPCRVIVRADTIADVIRKSDGQSVLVEGGSTFKTVAQMFSLVESLKVDGVAQLKVDYDPRFGFPSYIFVDYKSSMIDDEVGYRTTQIRQLIW